MRTKLALVVILLVCARGASCESEAVGSCPADSTVLNAAIEHDQARSSLESDIAELRALVSQSKTLLAELHGAIDRAERQLASLNGGTSYSGRETIPPASSAAVDVQSGLLLYGQQSLKTLARSRVLWNEHLKFRAAVHADATVRAIATMHDGGYGVRYVAVGDAGGHVNLFRWSGDLAYEFDAGRGHGVAAMAAVRTRRNVTLLMTGHDDGTLRVHAVHEHIPRSTHAAQHAAHEYYITNASLVLDIPGHDGAAATHVAALKANARYLFAVVDTCGVARVYRENGTLRAESDVGTAVHALRFAAMQLTMVTPYGAAVMSAATGALRRVECEGLNGSEIIAAAFDATLPHRAHATTRDGELLMLALGGDGGVRTCRVRARRQLGSVDAMRRVVAFKGYIGVATSGAIGVFNVTNAHRSGARDVLASSLRDIAASFGLEVVYNGDDIVLASSGGTDVIVACCGGVVAWFESTLPTLRPPEFKMKFWQQPFFIAAMILVGVWQFYRNKQRRFATGAQLDDFMQQFKQHEDARTARLRGDAMAVDRDYRRDYGARNVDATLR